MSNLSVHEYGRSGSDTTVVLLSSIATTHEAWAQQIPALEEDYRVITVDHRGHGGSEVAKVEPGSSTVQLLCDDLLHALDSAGVNRFAVVGLSLGGVLAQWLAANSGRVEKAVFASTATYLGGEERWSERTRTAREQGLDAMADGFLENWFTEGFRAGQPDRVASVREMIAGVDPEGYAQNGDALAEWDFVGELGKITCPVLTIAGAQDPSTTPAELAAIASGVAGPAESVVIDPGSHQVAIENPAEFNAALTRFLRS
ncbi:alpha/beta fold hydrolase [Corynebacterium bouchesdurhonense]|uniref:alpha/beta fold hydrolase n=1 Tax=Corynebacterium bouchesdurhonense TaxID=1720192 RepID=UPI000830A670|nr:alpha/beta fold hydrolase [Corynebacterium bouchesdurhonense]